MGATPPLSDAFGMPPQVVTIYMSLIEHPAASVTELAADCDLNVEAVEAGLAWLRNSGLVLRAKAHASDGDADFWSASEPDRALRDLVRHHERILDQVRGALPELQQRFRRTHEAPTVSGVIEHVEGWENVGARYHRILRDSAREVGMMEHAPYNPGAAPTEESILRRGVSFRVLCDPEDFPRQLGDEFAALRGLEARLYADVPFRALIADGQICLIILDRTPLNRAALVIHPSTLLDGICQFFDACWCRAVPIGFETSPLDDQAREVLTLLAAGLKDESVARQLGITTRTLRRRVQEILTALDTKSRFQAGIEASRRGWV